MSPLLLTTTARPEQPRPVFADPLPPSCRTVYLSTPAPLPVRPHLHQPIEDEPQVASRPGLIEIIAALGLTPGQARQPVQA